MEALGFVVRLVVVFSIVLHLSLALIEEEHRAFFLDSRSYRTLFERKKGQDNHCHVEM